MKELDQGYESEWGTEEVGPLDCLSLPVSCNSAKEHKGLKIG